jgi:hypothetical protein
MNDGLTGRSDDELPAAGEPSPVRYLHPPQPAPAPHRYNELLSRLVGRSLQSIQFVGGYVQFGFGQFGFGAAEATEVPILTCEVMPEVITPAGPVVDGQLGYADALRSLIGHDVVDTAEAHGEGLRVEFRETALALRPAATDVTGPLIAMLSDFDDGRSMSWQAGGEAYEYLR